MLNDIDASMHPQSLSENTACAYELLHSIELVS